MKITSKMLFGLSVGMLLFFILYQSEGGEITMRWRVFGALVALGFGVIGFVLDSKSKGPQ
jgi:hypothetical protein